jgi:hypothetical protein
MTHEQEHVVIPTFPILGNIAVNRRLLGVNIRLNGTWRARFHSPHAPHSLLAVMISASDELISRSQTCSLTPLTRDSVSGTDKYGSLSEAKRSRAVVSADVLVDNVPTLAKYMA